MIHHYSLDTYKDSLAITSGDGKTQYPSYSPPTEQFRREHATPYRMKVDRRRYGVFVFNQDRLDHARPVSITLPNRQSIHSTAGAAKMNALATQIERPIVAVDMPGDGLSFTPLFKRGLRRLTVEYQAITRLLILEKMGFDDVDMMGVCMGGVIAAHAATLGQDSVKQLLTYSTPGFETLDMNALSERAEKSADEADYVRMAVREDGFSLRDFAHLPSNPETRVAENAFAILGYSSLKSEMDKLPDRLHPTTKWQDVVGTADSLTLWQDHVDTVMVRGTMHPDSSSIKVLEDVGHEMPHQRIVLTGRDANLALSAT